MRDLTVEEARARMLADLRPGPAETAPLDAAAVGRVLAEAVIASRDQPVFDVSAMDGYAVAPADPAWPHFRLSGESAAGRPFTGELSPGETVRIFTGARVPAGAAVVVQERASAEGGVVRFEGPPPEPRAHVRSRAGDFAAGARLLEPGMRLDAWRLALAASAGRGSLQVAPRPRVAVLSSGEEIVRAGAQGVVDAQVFDSNGPALAALIAGWGGAPVPLAPVRDGEDAIADAVRDAPADLVVTVGGASVGVYDLVKPALRRLGLELQVETVRLRPGKPTWFGRLGDGRRILGLPGNPASSLATAELFLRPMLAAWQGADPTLPMLRARLDAPLPLAGPREHWMRARLGSGKDGALTVEPFADQDSSLVTVFAGADALLRRPAGAPAADRGEVAEVLRLDRR